MLGMVISSMVTKSFHIGSGNTVGGNNNVNVGFNSNLNGNGNWIVGNGHEVNGNGVIMFGPNADPIFYQTPTTQYYPTTTQYPTTSIPATSNQQVFQNNFNPFANQIVSNILGQNRWSSSISWP